MGGESLVFNLFLVFAGAGLLATAALFARQTFLVAYIFLGVLLGPGVTGLLSDPDLVAQLAHIGVMFLLFLLGLNLHPQRLMEMLREATAVTLLSSLLFGAVGAAVAQASGLELGEALVVGAAFMFSSTILGLKLLPTTVLHHRHAGRVIISILLLQDILAIVVLLVLQVLGDGALDPAGLGRLMLGLPAVIGIAFLAERYLLSRLFERFAQIQEYLFLVSIGWCLGMAELAAAFGLSPETGSFIAGVSIAAGRISLFIAESLKPLRDFFLVLFFVSLGATFDLKDLGGLLLPAAALAAALVAIKPAVFALLLRRFGESGALPWEVGVRLGQASEFSILIGHLAFMSQVIGRDAAQLIHLTTLLTFIASAYWIVLSYPTPVAVSDRLRRD